MVEDAVHDHVQAPSVAFADESFQSGKLLGRLSGVVHVTILDREIHEGVIPPTEVVTRPGRPGERLDGVKPESLHVVEPIGQGIDGGTAPSALVGKITDVELVDHQVP
jgi:hypothetical protein